MGGFGTVYTATFFGVAGKQFGMSVATPLARPLMTRAGLSSIAKNTVTSGGPFFMGLFFGVSAFGNSTELMNLIWNARIYMKEFKAVQKEFYY